MEKFRYFSDLLIGVIGTVVCGAMSFSSALWSIYALFVRHSFFASLVMAIMAYLLLVGSVYCFHLAKSYFVGKYLINHSSGTIEKNLSKPWTFSYKRISLPLERLRDKQLRSSKSTGWVEPSYASDGRLISSGHYQTTETFTVELLFDDEWFDFRFSSHLEAKNFLQKVNILKASV